MNCKPGDLALVVNSVVPENNGKMVTCLEIVPHPEHLGYNPRRGPMWRTDRNDLIGTWGSVDAYMFDCRLMPIRPQPDEFEQSPSETVNLQALSTGE